MKKITGIVLAYNEEEMIADCLDSLSFCSEIIVIDNGSTDKTVDIAKRMGARIIEDKSLDFAKKRNLGLDKATYPFVLYIDSDERVSEELKKEILSKIEKEKVSDAFRLKRINYYFGKHKWPKEESFLRLFQKKSLVIWEGTLHETAIIKGKEETLINPIYHYTHRDLSSMLTKTIMWSDIEAKNRFDTNHKKITWWRLIRVILTGFYDSYVIQKGYRLGIVGLLESIFQGFSYFVTYAKLWEMQNKKTHGN